MEGIVKVQVKDLLIGDQVFTHTADLSSTIKGRLIKNPIPLCGAHFKLEIVDDIPIGNVNKGSIINLIKSYDEKVRVLSRRA